MITDQGKLVRGSSLAEFYRFRKPLRVETRLTKIDETQQRVASWRVFFRKRIEKRSANLKISNINSRKLQTFRSSRKVWTFCGKDNPIDLTGAISQGIENYLSWQLVAGVILIFSTLQGNRRHYGHFQRAGYWIFVLQSLLRFWEKASSTTRRRSLDFR